MLTNALVSTPQLVETPSMSDGLPFDAELDLRALGCQVIQQIGVLLRLPQKTTAVAQVLFQRFWFTSSMCDFSANEIVLGCLLLSTKTEETQIRLRHLINAYHYLLFRLNRVEQQQANGSGSRGSHPKSKEAGQTASSDDRQSASYRPLGYESAEFMRIRDAAVVSEMQVLKRLSFHVQVELPYVPMVNYLQLLGLRDADETFIVKPNQSCLPGQSSTFSESASSNRIHLVQSAWSFLNDALQTPVMCIFGPHVIACTAIALAAEMCVPQIVLPTDPAPWWLLFDASEAEIKIVASYVLWRYHHQSCLADAPKLLDKYELRKYIELLTASIKSARGFPSINDNDKSI